MERKIVHFIGEHVTKLVTPLTVFVFSPLREKLCFTFVVLKKLEVQKGAIA